MKKSVIAFGILLSVMANNVNANVNPAANEVSDEKTKTSKVAPISLAIVKNDYARVENFIASGSSVEVKGKTTGMTPIMYAARYNNVELIKLLVVNGAKVQETSKYGLTALEYAEHANANDAATYLSTIINVAPISLAISQNDYQTVKKLLELGSDIEVKDKTMGMTPIIYAARYNNVDLLKLLVANGADAQEKSKLGLTAIEYAEHANATAAVSFLKTL